MPARPALLTLFACLLLAAPAAALTNRVVNGDFETGGTDPRTTPGWAADGSQAYRAQRLGTGGSASALLVGVGVLRSAALFAVTPGESLLVEVDVFEMRDDSDGRPGWRGDSVVALELVSATGATVRALEFHCDAYVDLLDNNAIDESDSCTAADGYVHLAMPQSAITCGSAECQKYGAAIVVPAGAAFARVLLGGSLATDTIDPFVTGIGLSSPTSLTAIDNVFVGN